MQRSFPGPFLLLAVAVLTAARPAAPSDSPVIDLSSSTPMVRLAPRGEGRFIHLPTLDIEFTVRPFCPTDLRPVSVTLSVADTLASMSASAFAEQKYASLTLQVPAMQLAPIAAHEFCLIAEDDSATFSVTEQTFADALTAHASLHCSGNGNELITYMSHTLDVTVRCEEEKAKQAQPRIE